MCEIWHKCLKKMKREVLLQISVFWGKITTFPLIFKGGRGGGVGWGGYLVSFFFLE